LKPSGFRGNGDRLIYGKQKIVIISVNAIDNAATNCKATYKTSATQGTRETLENLGQLISKDPGPGRLYPKQAAGQNPPHDGVVSGRHLDGSFHLLAIYPSTLVTPLSAPSPTTSPCSFWALGLTSTGTQIMLFDYLLNSCFEYHFSPLCQGQFENVRRRLSQGSHIVQPKCRPGFSIDESISSSFCLRASFQNQNRLGAVPKDQFQRA
jgi:hypothetical protein